MKTIEIFGLPSVLVLRNHGSHSALIQTETVEGEELDLVMPWPAARRLAEELKQTFKDVQ